MDFQIVDQSSHFLVRYLRCFQGGFLVVQGCSTMTKLEIKVRHSQNPSFHSFQHCSFDLAEAHDMQYNMLNFGSKEFFPKNLPLFNCSLCWRTTDNMLLLQFESHKKGSSTKLSARNNVQSKLEKEVRLELTLHHDKCMKSIVLTDPIKILVRWKCGAQLVTSEEAKEALSHILESREKYLSSFAIGENVCLIPFKETSKAACNEAIKRFRHRKEEQEQSAKFYQPRKLEHHCSGRLQKRRKSEPEEVLRTLSECDTSGYSSRASSICFSDADPESDLEYDLNLSGMNFNVSPNGSCLDLSSFDPNLFDSFASERNEITESSKQRNDASEYCVNQW